MIIFKLSLSLAAHVISFVYLLLLIPTRIKSQIMPDEYTTTPVKANETIAQGAWGMDIKLDEVHNQPRYDLTLWSTIGFPSIMTPCSYMYPVIISVKNLNYTFDSSPVSFSCNHAGLTGPIWISTAFGSISVNQTSTYYTACNIVVEYLNSYEPTMIQSTSATNFTYLIPGTLIRTAIESIQVEKGGISNAPGSDSVLTWLQQHYYSENWVNVGSILNLANPLTDSVVLPLKYKIDLPKEILSGSIVEGSNPAEHAYIDLFNITISSGRYSEDSNSNLKSSSSFNLWKPSRNIAGFLPPVINSAQGGFIAIQNNVTLNEYNSAVPFAWTNIALGVSPIKVILPSNLPNLNNTDCSSGYLFYYPIDPFWNPSNNSKPYNLSHLLNGKISSTNLLSSFSSYHSRISRNTVQTSLFFSKRPFLNSAKYNGQLQNTLSTYLTFSNNFIGGCYYNGTFPYDPKSPLINGYKAEIGLCGSQINEFSTQFKSPYYRPPIHFLSGPSPYNYFFTITSLVQYIGYTHKGTFKTDLNDDSREIKGLYPSNGLLHSLLLASPVNPPFILFSLPNYINDDTSVVLGDAFYQFGERYINRNYGLYGTPGSGSTCRAARFIPIKRDLYSLKVVWQCRSRKTPISESWEKLIDEPRETVSSCDINNEYESCLLAGSTTANGYPGMINSYTKEHVSSLRGLSFKTDRFLAISLTMFTDTMYYTSPRQTDRKSVKLFSPPVSDFIAPNYCVKIPMIPMIPVKTNKQTFIIYPTVKPWDHVKNTKYSFIVPFNTPFKIRHKITLGYTTNIDANKEFYVTSNLFCENLRKISGTTNIKKITISDVLDSSTKSLIITTKYPVVQNSRFSDCINQLIISETNAPTSVATSYEAFMQSVPKNVKNEFVSIEFGGVDFPPSMGKLSYLQPNGNDGVSLGDSIYLRLNNLQFTNKEQDDGFSSFGAIASSSQIITKNSTVILLGDSLTQFPSSIRLPATRTEWYVYLRVQTVTNSGCFVPCQFPIKNTVYSHWCTNDPTLLNSISCPYVKILTKGNDSDTEIENAIALVTHPLAYTSPLETINIVRGLFEQKPNNKIIWNTYFDAIFSMSIELQQTPRAYDFPGFKLLSLDIIKKVAETYLNNNDKFDLEITRLFNVIMNVTLNAECTNNPGVQNLVLEITDLLIKISSWSEIFRNKNKANIISRLLEAVGNRFSFWSYSGDSFKWDGSESGVSFYVQTIDEITTKKPININGFAIGGFKFSEIQNLIPVESIYFHSYPEEYDSEMLWFASSSCPNVTATISNYMFPNKQISDMLIYNAIHKKDTPIQVGGSTIYLCSVDYYSHGNIPVTFTIPLSFDIPVNMTNIGCAMNINSEWRSDLCSSNISPIRQESKQFVVECSCQGFAPYAIVANVTSTEIDNGHFGESDNGSRPQTPPMDNKWDGISGNLSNIGISKQDALEIINSSYSGFIFINEKIKTEHIPSNAQKLLGNDTLGIAALYSQMGRSQYIANVSSTWGYNAGEAWFNSTVAKGGDINVENFLSWEPFNSTKSKDN
ncbi:hypothetical protein FG386_002722 [Cryptosporidium ryanae]|uniref:uncharacterized protein n=1 Tax=Cryptosporidium ryanae TaxID=515981 RepID=UPI003519E3CF|nr:hypothetical protein FG386_002722 [Cryptosporidium ryanae]